MSLDQAFALTIIGIVAVPALIGVVVWKLASRGRGVSRVTPRRVGFHRPRLAWQWWPTNQGGDEWGRHVTLLGWPWSGRIAIASRKPACIHHDRKTGGGYIHLVQPDGNPVRVIRTIESVPGIHIDIDATTGRAIGIEILDTTPQPYDPSQWDDEEDQ